MRRSEIVVFPNAEMERALHKRMLAREVDAPADLYQLMMGAMVQALRHDLHCLDDEAHDGATDAILHYMEDPSRYVPDKGRLSTYLMQIAKRRVIDRIRSRTADERRGRDHAKMVELRASTPNVEMEVEAEADQLWRMIESEVPEERDRRALRLILDGESSTETLAEALELQSVSPAERRHLVKQHRDRLSKALVRFGRKLKS